MACPVAWSPEALEDVESIAEYISRDSPAYARAVVAKIVAATRDLPRFQYTGRIIPEVSDPSLRERFVYSYRLIYRVKDSEILIVAVIHGARLFESLSDRFVA